ncbi:hypothetical protein Plhal710r2_c023g0096471 [Plasmopara halstedii]
MAVFQLNVFRVCSLVVFIMITYSKNTNLVLQCGGSYKPSHKYMLLVPQFPRYQLMLHNDREQQGWSKAVKRYSVLQDIATHSRGRDCATNLCDLLDEACAAVSLRTHDGKKFLHSHDVKTAQVMAISYFNSAGNSRKKRRHEVGAFGMHLHFANLVDEQLTDMTISDVTLGTSSGTWTLTCCFSAINEDMLLYLAIFGGKIFQATMTTKIGRSTQRSIYSRSDKYIPCPCKHERCVSRLEGVREYGCTCNLLFVSKEWYAQRLSSTIIHLLAPLNAEWPKWNLDQNSYECKFGHLFRARNKEWCDLYV